MIIDVILACSLNFCEFDCLFKKVAYNVRLGVEIYLYCYEKTKDKLLALDCYNKDENKKLSRKSTYVKKVLNVYNMFDFFICNK
jgi:hypothetical protein